MNNSIIIKTLVYRDHLSQSFGWLSRDFAKKKIINSLINKLDSLVAAMSFKTFERKSFRIPGNDIRQDLGSTGRNEGLEIIRNNTKAKKIKNTLSAIFVKFRTGKPK